MRVKASVFGAWFSDEVREALREGARGPAAAVKPTSGPFAAGKSVGSRWWSGAESRARPTLRTSCGAPVCRAMKAANRARCRTKAGCAWRRRRAREHDAIDDGPS